MAKKEALHVLVHSLSRSEKRYFRLFCQRQGKDQNYLRLFDAIEQQSEYDETLIRQQFKGATFLKQLHVAKHYLRNLILKSLRNFHSNLSKTAELGAILQNIEILFHKELYQLCAAEIQRAEKLAEKFELSPGMAQAKDWRRRLEQIMEPSNYGAFQLALEQQEKAILASQNTNEYWQLAVELTTERPDQSPLSTSREQLLEGPDRAITLEAKVVYHNISYLRNLRLGRESEAEKSLQELIQLLEGVPERMRESPGWYVSSVNNLVSYLLFQKKFQAGLELIQKAKGFYEDWRIQTENRSLLKQMLRTFNLEMEIYRDNRAIKLNEQFFERTELFVTSNRFKMPKEYWLSFCFQFASIHFMKNDLEQSQQWINRLLNERFRGLRTDLQVQARVLNLIIHFEQRNSMVLRYFVDNTRRFMKKVKEVQPFEKELLRFFIRLGRIGESDYPVAFQEFKAKLYPANGEVMVPAIAEEYIDYRSWIDRNLK